MSYLNGEINVWPEIGAVFFDVLLLVAAFRERNVLKRSRRFYYLVLAILVATLVDIPASVILGLGIPIAYPAMVALIFLCYAGSGFSGYAACYYVESFTAPERIRVVSKVNRALLALFLLILFFNSTILPGIVRGFNYETNAAFRGPLFIPIAYGIPMYFMIYAMALTFPGMTNSMTISNRQVIYIMYILVFLGYFLQFFSGGLKFSYTFMSIGIYVVYLGIETPDYRRLKDTLEQLREAELSAEKAGNAKTDFLASMSHDIRTPINAILGFDEMILRESSEEHVLSYARDMRKAGMNLLELVNTILDYSRINAGKLTIRPEEYELMPLLERLREVYEPLLSEKDVAFHINADRSIPNRLTGDVMRIRQILENLLSNAVKFTEKGEVTLTVQYRPRMKNELYLDFAVADTGVGIREEDIGKLHQAFRRIDEIRSLTAQGTGLGMNIVETLLHMMGSDLKIESEYGTGSTFSFSLLQEYEGVQTLGDAYDTAYAGAQEEKGTYKRRTATMMAPMAKVLVIDDTPLNLTVIKGLLKPTHVQIDTVLSGAAGIALASAKPYDIIFIDHLMPEMDGIETLYELRKDKEGMNANTPCIALTGNTGEGMREKYLEAGFTDYLEKPVQAVDLIAALMKYLPTEKVME